MNGWIMPNIGTVRYTPTRFIALLYVPTFLLKREWRPCVKPFTTENVASFLNLLFCGWFVFLFLVKTSIDVFRLEERSLFRRPA